MPDIKGISFFPPAASVGADDLLFLSAENASASSGYDTKNIRAADLGSSLLGDFEYTQELDTDVKKPMGAINELHGSIGADAYDPDATYNTGDLCIKESTLYKCNDDNVTGAWNSAKWDATTIAAELALKANSANTYTKAEVYTKSQVDTSLSGKQDKLNKGTLGSTVDLDTLFANSVYYLSGATTTQHAPCSYGMLEVINATLTLQRVTQVGTQGTSNLQYERIYINNAWTAWKTITRS